MAIPVGLGLAKAVTTDPDVFLMAVAGCLLGSRYGPTRGLGKGLTMYIVARRVDAILGSFDSKLGVIVGLMRERNTPTPMWSPDVE